jgi:hypothetical protein
VKATSEQIIAAYRETGSVWKAAKQLGMVGQSVWERLRALGIQLPGSKWTADEIEELKALISTCTLTEIANRLGRPYAGVACMASRLGIVTRHGNKRVRKVPRGQGLNKASVARMLKELKASPQNSLRAFCRAHSVSIDSFALAVQKYDPEAWRLIAWQRGLAEKVCPACDAAFYPMTTKQRACSRRCAETHRRDLSYFGGRRKEAIGLSDGICQLCLQPKSSLSAHHMLGKANDEQNDWLIAICSGCHQLVTLAAARNFLDTSAGWERLAELVLARRLADQGGPYLGTHVAVDVEYLTQSDLVDLSLVDEETRQ